MARAGGGSQAGRPDTAPIPPAGPTVVNLPAGAIEGFDALLPPQMALRAETIGIRKAGQDTVAMLALGVLAGAFIALGAIFSVTASAGTSELPFGIARLVAGVTFSLGLILVVVAGAELFTGNVLLVMGWASRRISTRSVLRNWTIVYIGNFVGAIGTVGLVVASGWYAGGEGSVGTALLATAQVKASRPFLDVLMAGILCNALVCLAVWLTYSARSTTDRILAIVPPITAFVAAGFEHSIANMFYLPAAILVRAVAPPSFWGSTGTNAEAYAAVDIPGFLGNLVPATIGNVIGGAVLVGAVYWVVYLRRPAQG
jgi:formate transporter